MQSLTRDQLRQQAPSIFATQPWEGMSSRYRFIGTDAVLDMMAEQGFHPTKAVQSRVRLPGKQGFQRHMIRLRHESFSGDEVPEAVLVNSHDRSSAYHIYTGIMRFVCENGMIVQSADFGGFSIRHSGSRDLFAQVRDATSQIMEGIPAIMGRIDAWKGISLSPADQLAFAELAWELKPHPSILPAQLLTPRRQEDAPDANGSRSLWATLNCAQEWVLKGGIQARNHRGRRVTTRAVRAVDADLRINRRLWELAEMTSLN